MFFDAPSRVPAPSVLKKRGTFPTKDMEVGRRIQVRLTGIRRYLVGWFVKWLTWTNKSWRIVNQLVRREEETRHRHLSYATIQSCLSLYSL